MRILVTRGSGEGPTTVSAFDAALKCAGVHDLNLIQLSSVIPYRARVVVERFERRRSDTGKKLFVVLARQDASATGTEACAGLAWAQSSRSGRGIFVEHGADSEALLLAALDAGLTAMAAARDEVLDVRGSASACITSRGLPVCAVVVAVYAMEGW